MALSVEKVRHEMLRGILVPRDLVNRALSKTAAKLDAKETKFFSHKGEVVETHEVEDHGIQLQAADQIFSLSGLYARERAPQAQIPSVALEVSPDGVIRLVVGTPFQSELSAGEGEVLEVGTQDLADQGGQGGCPAAGGIASPEPTVARTRHFSGLPQARRKAPIPPEVWRIISDEVVE